MQKKLAERRIKKMTLKIKSTILISLCLAGVLMMSSCKASDMNTSEVTEVTVISVSSAVVAASKEATETAVVTKPTQIAALTPIPSVKETTAAPTKITETAAPAATTKATTAQAVTTEAPTSTTQATSAATTATTTAETTPPTATTALYTPNCDNIKSYIVNNLQSRGYWFPDAVSIGGGSAALTTNYYYSDELFAEGFLLKFTNIDKTSTGVISVSVWIENGYVNFLYDKCAYPTV